MKKTCIRGFIRLILSCLLGISFASQIDAGQYLEKNDTLVLYRDTGMFLAAISASTDPVQCRIKKTGRTFGADHMQPPGLSSASGRLTRHFTLSWLFEKTEKNPVSGPNSPNLHDRAPPSP